MFPRLMPISTRRFPFLSQSADQARLPVAIVSGFLGSGKTTLVNALLRDPRMKGTAVAVNEFGPVPLDHELIDHGQDKTVVLANGCLCCNLAGDMEDAVMRLFTRRTEGDVPQFRRLIIEPSGLSDPAPIAQAILRNPMMSRCLRLAAIVTTVDALFGLNQLAQHDQTCRQVSLADRLVLTKPDLADPLTAEALRAALSSLNLAAPILTAENGQIDAGLLFPDDFFEGGEAADRSGFIAEALGPDHTARVDSVSLAAEAPLNWRAFDAWFRGVRIRHADALLRAKGMLDVADVEGPVVVQAVHHVASNPVALEAWPGQRRSRLVLIADPETITAIRGSWTEALPGLLAHRDETASG